MPEDMPEDMPGRMPDRMPEDMSEYMPEDMPDRMPDRMPEDMSDRMPEDMPDRMPEDMPDRKLESLLLLGFTDQVEELLRKGPPTYLRDLTDKLEAKAASTLERLATWPSYDALHRN